MSVRSLTRTALSTSSRCFSSLAATPRAFNAQRQLAVPMFASPSFALSARRHMSKDRASKIVKPGEAIIVDGAPHKVKKITQGKRGKGGGYVRAILKNLISGNMNEKTFTSDEIVEGADMEKDTYQYSWTDGNMYSFLNAQTFEEVQVPKDDLELAEFLVEGQEVKLLKFKDKVIGAEMARTQEFEVVSVDEQKTSSGQHAAILNSGAEIFVPMFIHPGMKVRINVYEREYVEKA